MATGRIGVTPVLRTRWSKLPTTGTTVLSGLDDNSVALVYDAGYEAVYRNGVLLSRGNDYTATDGTTVTLIDATLATDIIEIFANDLVPLTDAISKGQFTAKGALLSATAASTPAVLAVGANGTVLTADSAETTGLKWVTPAAGGMTLLSTTAITASASISITGIDQTYTDLMIVISNAATSNTNIALRGTINSVTTSTYSHQYQSNDVAAGAGGNAHFEYASAVTSTANVNSIGATFTISNYTNAATYLQISSVVAYRSYNASPRTRPDIAFGASSTGQNAAVTSIQLFPSAGTWTAQGNILIYGVK